MNRAYVLMTPDFIGGFCRPGGPYRVVSPIPIDAKFVTASFSYERNSFLVLFEHPSFPGTKPGEHLPCLPPIIIHTGGE